MHEWGLEMVVAVLSIIAVVVLFVNNSASNRKEEKKRNLRFPPGPRPWPVVGNLGLLGSLPHQALAELSKKYGPLMFLRLGSKPAIVASSPKMAQEILKTRDKVFASRPLTTAAKEISYDCQGIGAAPYGPKLRHGRKVLTLELLSADRIHQFQNLRRENAWSAVHSVLEDCKGTRAVRIDRRLGYLTANNITSMMLNRCFFGPETQNSKESRDFNENVNEILRLCGVFHLGDYIPLLKNIDVQGQIKLMRAVHQKMDGILQGMIDEHRRKIIKSTSECTNTGLNQNSVQDFVDFLLTRPSYKDERPIDDEFIKAILQDVIVAGTDTTATTIEWALTELLKNHRILSKAQEELDSVVGRDRLVEESDIPNLHYLQNIIKETLRLHPPGPLLVPHESLEACEVGGFFIPKGSLVLVNVWAIGRDPEAWDEPLKFHPERFDHSSVDVAGHDYQLLPFGSGRRICPGKNLGMTFSQYTLAVFLQSCNLALPDGLKPEDLDMSEKFGLSVPKAVPLEVLATPRLPLSLIDLSRRH